MLKKLFPNKKIVISFILILLLAGFLRVYKLDQQSFIADEYIGIQASYGHNQTGKWQLWDFNKGELTDEKYTRAKIYYAQVSKVFDFLAPTEKNSRLVSVLWGMIGVVLIFLITFFVTKNPTIALFSTVFLSVSISALLFDRKFRMYSMFAPVYLLFSFSVFQFIESKPGKKSFKIFRKLKKKTTFNWIYLIPVVVLWKIAMATHDLALNILPMIGIYFVVMAVVTYLKNRELKSNKYLWFVGISAVIVAVFISSDFVQGALFHTKFVSNWSYLEKVTFDYSHLILAFSVIVFGSYFLAKKYDKAGIWTVVSFFSLLVFAMFFWRKNVGDQYIYFAQPFKVIIIATGVYYLVKIVTKKIFDRSKKHFVILSIFSFVILINLPFFFSKDSFYEGSRSWNHPNYREVFHYYLKHREDNSAIATRQLTNYYLDKSNSNVIPYSFEERLSLDADSGFLPIDSIALAPIFPIASAGPIEPIPIASAFASIVRSSAAFATSACSIVLCFQYSHK